MPLNKISHMNEADHILVTQAVAAVEEATSGEIVTIVTDQSDHYNDIAIAWATIMAFFTLSIVTVFPSYFSAAMTALSGGWDYQFTVGEYLGGLFVLMAAVWICEWAVMKWMPMRMFFTPKYIKERRVRERAVQLFKVGAESRTHGRTGILIFLSMREHRAEIVADKAIADKVSPEIWGDAMLAMIAHVRGGEAGKGMAAAVEQVGIVLREHFPPNTDNPNELPDRLIEI
jgi:putative membrane protein